MNIELPCPVTVVIISIGFLCCSTKKMEVYSVNEPCRILPSYLDKLQIYQNNSL